MYAEIELKFQLSKLRLAETGLKLLFSRLKP
jgi:hypothetical protein